VSTAVVRRARRKWGMTAIGIVLVAIFIFPLYWMVTTSVKPAGELFTNPPTWFPTKIDITPYIHAVFGNPQMMTSIGNSAIISIGSTILTVVLAAPAAYGFARLKLRWSGLLLFPFLLAQLLPTINLALPLYALFSQAGLINSYQGLIIANTVLNLPFAVIVLRPFYISIPKEMEEAAAIDGANRFQAFMRIILPVVRPGIVTVSAFAFVMTWGEFTIGLTLGAGCTARDRDAQQLHRPVRNRLALAHGGVDGRGHPHRRAVRRLPAIHHGRAFRGFREGLITLHPSAGSGSGRSLSLSKGQNGRVTLAEQRSDGLDEFEAQRSRLFGIAYRMLGTVTDAEDILQDAWLRWQGTDCSGVAEPASFLARVVTNLCLNALGPRPARRRGAAGHRVVRAAHGARAPQPS
jgi:multiple sugar transport system permease protein